MHKIGKLGLQVFAAPDNMTGQAQIKVKAREIDFVTSFGKNIQALLGLAIGLRFQHQHLRFLTGQERHSHIMVIS